MIEYLSDTSIVTIVVLLYLVLTHILSYHAYKFCKKNKECRNGTCKYRKNCKWNSVYK